MTDFLLELLSEEIPARMQARARNELARLFAANGEGRFARRIARHIVASLNCWPWCSAHQAQCSSTVASDAASNRSRRIASRSGPMRRG